MLIGFGRLDDDREDVDFVDVDPLDDFDEEEEDEDDDDERRFERDPLRLYCFAGAASTSSSEGIKSICIPIVIRVGWNERTAVPRRCRSFRPATGIQLAPHRSQLRR